jgi:hypothetical protein
MLGNIFTATTTTEIFKIGKAVWTAQRYAHFLMYVWQQQQQQNPSAHKRT